MFGIIVKKTQIVELNKVQRGCGWFCQSDTNNRKNILEIYMIIDFKRPYKMFQERRYIRRSKDLKKSKMDWNSEIIFKYFTEKIIIKFINWNGSKQRYTPLNSGF